MIEFEAGSKINTKLILDYLQENKMSKSKFCKLCKISNVTYEKMMTGSLDFGVVSLFKVATVLNRQMHEMFE